MEIGKVELNFDNYLPDSDIYSDGDIENEILDIIKCNKKYETLNSDDRWPILYHLSDERKNILRWFPFKQDSSILEIGTGCGAITELFCEKKLMISGIESSKRRAKITAYRNKNYSKLKLYVGNFMDMQFDEKYDYITLIGVLEYARMFIDGNRAYDNLIRKCKSLLKTNGQLIIAIENRLGIKYWAGAPEDHTGRVFDGIENYSENSKVRTFSKKELTTLLNGTGFKRLKWYYPYPDYKFSHQVFSDEFLPRADWLFEDIVSYNSDRLSFFDERKALQAIADSDNFPEFSNSFLVICE